MSKKVVGLFFGGRSVEHEVSVITALQAYENLDKEKYHVIPIYVSKAGEFFTNHKFLDIKNYKDINALLLSSKQLVLANKGGKGGFLTQGFFGKFIPLDVVLPLFHGSFGEDGSFQGLCEIYQIPYAGFNVLGSALAMDKEISKAIFKDLGFQVSKSITVKRNDWIKNPKDVLRIIKNAVKFPVFVKPSDIGSTIGVSKAKNLEELSFSIEVAAVYSDKIVIEEAFEDCIEVNCAVLGYKRVIASVCEMPIRSGEVLSFDDKYIKSGKGAKRGRGGMASLSRKIPAPISDKLTKQIQEATVKIFEFLEGCGVARIDYFVDPKKEIFWVNEVNSPPGSLAFYLYEPMGIKYKELLDILISDAKERFDDQQKTQHFFDSGLLSQMSTSGSKK